MRFIALLACGMCFADSFGQDLAIKLTYETRAKPLRAVVADLSKQAGVKLKVASELENEPIILRLKGVPLKETMDRIASTVEAEWETTPDGGRRLWRSAELKQRLQRERIAPRIATIERRLLDLRKQLEDQGPFDQARSRQIAANIASASMQIKKQPTWDLHQKLQGGDIRSPKGRTIARLLIAVGAEELARVETGSVTLFSNLPTAMQRPLPQALLGVLRAGIEEHNMVAAELEALLKSSSTADIPIASDQYLRQYLTRLQGEPARFVLKVKADYFGELNALLVGVNQHGKGLIVTQYSLGGTNAYADWDQKRRAFLEDAQKQPRLELGEASKSLIGFFRWAMHSRAGVPPSVPESVTQLVLNPEKHDPLASIVSESFLRWAESAGLNAVVYPEDTIHFAAVMAAQDGGLTAAKLLEAVRTFARSDVKLQDRWLTCKPVEPLEALSARTDRAALGSYLRRLARERYLSLENEAALASAHDTHEMPWLAAGNTMFVARHPVDVPFNHWRCLRFFASLSAEQRKLLQAPEGLLLNMLNSEQRELLHKLLISGNASFSYHAPPPAGTDLEDEAMMLILEPTEIMPNGLPSTMQIEMEDSTAEALFTSWVDSSGGQGHDTTTWESLAELLALDEQGSNGAGAMSVSLGHSRTVKLRFSVSERQRCQIQLKELRRGLDSEWPISNLPPHLKARLDREVARARQRFKPAEPKPTEPPAQVTK